MLPKLWSSPATTELSETGEGGAEISPSVGSNPGGDAGTLETEEMPGAMLPVRGVRAETSSVELVAGALIGRGTVLDVNPRERGDSSGRRSSECCSLTVLPAPCELKGTM